MGDQKKEEEWL